MTQHHQHWATQNERGNRLFLNLTALMVRHLPAFFMKPCIAFVVMYFYLTSPQMRRNIARYQQRLKHTFHDVRLPETLPVFKQFLAFGTAICDRFAVWQRKIRYENLVLHDPDNVYALIKGGGRGHIFVCSHFGNAEICRALVSHHQNFKLNVLVHNRHAQAFNAALEKAGADRIQLIQVDDLDAQIMMELNRRIEAGEWLAIAADRVPVRGEKTVAVSFLGCHALMPQGAWLLAALLKTQIHTLFCVKENGSYHLKLAHFMDTSHWQRSTRQTEVAHAAQKFADLLAEECRQNPLQWFNFYNFWDDKHDD